MQSQNHVQIKAKRNGVHLDSIKFIIPPFDCREKGQKTKQNKKTKTTTFLGFIRKLKRNGKRKRGTGNFMLSSYPRVFSGTKWRVFGKKEKEEEKGGDTYREPRERD